MVIAVLVLAAAVIPGFELRQETARADWYAKPGLKIDIKKCEKFLAKTEKLFGVTVPRFTYLRVQFPEQVFALSPTHLYAEGVTDADTMRILSTKDCHVHEIVHLVTFQLGNPDRLLAEGIAQMLGNDNTKEDRRIANQHAWERGDTYMAAALAINRPVSDNSEVYDWYVLGDDWVRYLVKHYGIRKFVAFIKGNCKVSAADAFRQVYGQELDDVFNEWLYGKSRQK